MMDKLITTTTGVVKMELEFDEEILQELEDAGYDSELYQLVCEAENYIMSVGEFLDAGDRKSVV